MMQLLYTIAVFVAVFVCTACGVRNHFQVLNAHLLTFKCLSLAAILGKLTFGILGKKQKKN